MYAAEEIECGQKLTARPDMSETVQTVSASCGQLSQHHQYEASHGSCHSCSPLVGLRDVPAGHREAATDRGLPASGFALSRNYCNQKEKQQLAGRGERPLLDVSKKTYDDHVGAGQLSDDDIQISDREPLREDVNTDLAADTSASLSDDLYNMYDTAFSRTEQWIRRSLDSSADDYQEQALDLSRRSTIRDGSCPEKKSQLSSINSLKTTSLFDGNEVEENVMVNAPRKSGLNQFHSQQTSDASDGKPYLAASHFQNSALLPQNTVSTQLETSTRNVSTIHRPIPVYPHLGYPLFSHSLNLFHIGEHPLQSPLIPFDYEAGNTYTSPLHRPQNGPSVPWSMQGVNCACVPRTPEYDRSAVHYFSCFSDDPNRHLAAHSLSSMRHNNTPAEPSPTRLMQIFPFTNPSQPYVGHADPFLFNQMIWMNSVRKAQFQSSSDCDISSKGGKDICDGQQLHDNYSSQNVWEHLSAYRDNCYLGHNIPTPVRSRSWLNSDVQFHGHAFRPVYNYRKRQYNLDHTLRQPEAHKLSLQSKFYEHMQSSSLPLKQDVNSVSVDVRKADDIESFPRCNKFLNNQFKNPPSEDVSQGKHLLNKAKHLLCSSGSSTQKSCIDDTITGVNRFAPSYTDDKIWRANECRNVFGQHPQSSNKHKRKLKGVDADNASKQSKQQNIATLVHVTQVDNQPFTTPAPANNVSLCQTGVEVNCQRQSNSKDRSDPHNVSIKGQAAGENEQPYSNKKHVHCDDENMSASAHTLQCVSESFQRSGSKDCNKPVSYKPGISGFSSVSSNINRERNSSSCKDYTTRHKNSKKSNEIIASTIPIDNSTQQTSVQQMSTDGNCFAHNSRQSKHVDCTEELLDRLKETRTYQLSKSNSVHIRSPLSLTKDKESRNVEQSRSVVNLNIEEHTRAITGNCRPKRATRVVKTKHVPEKTVYCTPTTTFGSVVSSYPSTIVGGKKNINIANAVGNRTKLLKCKDCNSKHRSFSALLQHQSRDCRVSTSSSAPVHATDCVGSYMRYDTSWVGDKCQCTPCPVCKGVFGSKFRVFSHLQRGCYKEKVLPRTSDSLGPDGCQSDFPDVKKTSGTCKLHCCIFRSQAEKIHQSMQSDFPGCSSTYRSEIAETVPPSSSSDNVDIKKTPHSKTTYQQAPANNMKSVSDENIRFSSNLVCSAVNKDKYNAPQILSNTGAINTTDSPSCLPAPSVITEKTTSCAPLREVKAAMITSNSTKTNKLPNFERFHCQKSQTAMLHVSYKCDKLAGGQETFALTAPDDVIEPHFKYNPRDIKVMNTFPVEADTKLLINDHNCVSKKSPGKNTGKEDVEVKQEIDICVEDAAMIDQPEASSRLAADRHDLLTGHVATVNKNVKSDVPDVGTDISQATSNLGISEDSKQPRCAEQSPTHSAIQTP